MQIWKVRDLPQTPGSPSSGTVSLVLGPHLLCLGFTGWISMVLCSSSLKVGLIETWLWLSVTMLFPSNHCPQCACLGPFDTSTILTISHFSSAERSETCICSTYNHNRKTYSLISFTIRRKLVHALQMIWLFQPISVHQTPTHNLACGLCK